MDIKREKTDLVQIVKLPNCSQPGRELLQKEVKKQQDILTFKTKPKFLFKQISVLPPLTDH